MSKGVLGRRKQWSFYMGFFRGKTHVLFLSLVLSLVQAALFLPVAEQLRHILNDHIKNQDLRSLTIAGGWILGLFLLEAGIRMINKYYVAKHNKEVHNLIRDDLFVRLYQVPKSFYTRLENIKWHTILTHDVLRLDALSTQLFTSVAPAILISAALGVVMIYINWLLFVLMAAIAPVSESSSATHSPGATSSRRAASR